MLLGLGAGEAHSEATLVQALLASKVPGPRLFLVDLSPSLLVAGFRHVSVTLAGAERAQIFAIQGDMRKLPSYASVLARRRRRVACMFGDTFSTLENEATFVRHSLGALNPGDLLLFDVPLALAVPQEELHLRPGALAGRTAPPQLVEFLTGPLYRHSAAIRTVVLSAVLDHTACIIPGSYAVEYQAAVRVDNQAPRRFSLYHAKRHDPDRLVQSLACMSWDVVERWAFGDAQSLRALLLFQKRA